MARTRPVHGLVYGHGGTDALPYARAVGRGSGPRHETGGGARGLATGLAMAKDAA
ncbi:MAG: hypothetical protein ACE5GZ_13390 [Gammaproteobacteria bacterium]